MQYKLVNKKTKEENICSKITIGGFVHYVTEEEPIKNNWFLHKTNADCSIHKCIHRDGLHVISNNNMDYFLRYCKKIIATNNPNIDIPKVVDEVERLAWCIINSNSSLIEDIEKIVGFTAFYEGYNQSKETHPFNKEDLIDYGKWYFKEVYDDTSKTEKELFEIWNNQRLETIYYE